MVGESHVGVFTIIKELQKEQQQVDVQAERILCGKQQPKQKKNLIDRKRRIMMVIDNREDYSEMDFLRGIAHNLSL